MQKQATWQTRLPGLALTAVRIVFGIWWLSQFSWKPPPTFGCPNGGLCEWLDKEIQYPLIPLYGQFVQAVARPLAIPFGYLAFLTETALGVSFILGLFTRLGGLVGTLWSLNLLIGLVAIPGETFWYYLSMILLNVLYFGVGSRGQWALDNRMRLPEWLAFWASKE